MTDIDVLLQEHRKFKPPEAFARAANVASSDVHARAAKDAGLKLVVNSDGHQIRAQNYVEFGIGQARRGWLTKEDVLNTRTWKQLDKLRRKRP